MIFHYRLYNSNMFSVIWFSLLFFHFMFFFIWFFFHLIFSTCYVYCYYCIWFSYNTLFSCFFAGFYCSLPSDQSLDVTLRLGVFVILLFTVLPFGYGSAFWLLLLRLCSNRCAEALVVYRFFLKIGLLLSKEVKQHKIIIIIIYLFIALFHFTHYLCLVSLKHNFYVWYPWLNIYVWIHDRQYLCLVSMIHNIYVRYPQCTIFWSGIHNSQYLSGIHVTQYLCLVYMIQKKWCLVSMIHNICARITFVIFCIVDP